MKCKNVYCCHNDLNSIIGCNLFKNNNCNFPGIAVHSCVYRIKHEELETLLYKLEEDIINKIEKLYPEKKVIEVINDLLQQYENE